MTIINLRKYYPELYGSDYEIAVPDEVAAALREFKRREAAHRMRTYRASAYFSLNRDDEIEGDALYPVPTPHEVLEHKLAVAQLCAAIASLPEKQRERIYAYYVLGMSKTAVAKAEGVSRSRVTESIGKALRHMGEFLENLL